MKTMNILKVLSRTWGSARKYHMNLYRSFLRTHPNYEAIIYQSPAPSTWKMSDLIHHLGICLSTGAFRTSCEKSLYSELNEWSLHFQRLDLPFVYFVKVNANHEYPTHCTITSRLPGWI